MKDVATPIVPVNAEAATSLIRENWVPLDILNLLLQMDVDVLARMQTFFRRGALP